MNNLEHKNIEKIEQKRKLTKAVVLAGGLGTRFLPGTLVVAKELFPIMGKPVMLYLFNDLIKAGIKDVLIVGNKLKEESITSFLNPPEEYLRKVESDGKLGNLKEYNDIMSHFDSVSYVNQEIGSELFKLQLGNDSEARGSSVAILAAKEWANGEPFMVLNGDDFCYYMDGRSASSEVANIYSQTGDYVIYGKEVDRSQIYKYSSMVIGKALQSGQGFKMDDIIEKPAVGTEPSNIMGFARYVFTADVFDEILNSRPRPNGEFCITDVVSEVAKKGRVSTCIFDGKYFDCGSYLGFQMAGNYLLAENEADRKALLEEMKNLFSLYNDKSDPVKE